MATQVDIGELRVGSYVILEGEPCKIKKIERSAPGKHGHAKYRIMAEGVFDKRTRNLLKPAHTAFMSPEVTKKVGQVVSVSGNHAQLMDMKTYEMIEIDLGDKKVSPGEEVTFWDIEGRRFLE